MFPLMNGHHSEHDEDTPPQPPAPDHFTVLATPINSALEDLGYVHVARFEPQEGALFLLMKNGRRISIPLSAFVVEITPEYVDD